MDIGPRQRQAKRPERIDSETGDEAPLDRRLHQDLRIQARQDTDSARALRWHGAPRSGLHRAQHFL